MTSMMSQGQQPSKLQPTDWAGPREVELEGGAEESTERKRGGRRRKGGEKASGEFSAGPIVKTQCFRPWWPRFNLWLGN